MAGINLSAKAGVVFFGERSGDDLIAVTVSGADGVLPGTDAGRIKVSRFEEFPAKGRATGGVRAHAFLRGEDRLTLAWVGRAPALAVGPDGSTRTLPEARREAGCLGSAAGRRHRLDRPHARPRRACRVVHSRRSVTRTVGGTQQERCLVEPLRRSHRVTSSLHLLALHEPQAGTTFSRV